MNKEDFGAIKNLYESIINEAPLRDEPLWDGPGDNKPAGPGKAKPKPSAPGNEKPGYSGPPTPGTETAPVKPTPEKPTSVKPAKPGTSSPANATTAQKIKGGLEVYKSQVKSGDVKGAEATGKATWAAANPKLAAAQAERDRTRGTSASTNPQMAGLKDRLPAPKSLSPTTVSAAYTKSTPALSSSTSAVQSGGSAAAAKPTTNQAATAFSSPALVKPTPSTSPIKKPGAVMSSFEWGTMSTIKDIANAYASIYEGKKKDQDQDGDEDFADVMIARMMASGMSRAEAIAAVRNKEYNEEYVTEDPVQDFRDMRRTKENASGVRGPELSHSAVAANSPSTKRQPRSREFSHGGGPTSSAQPRSREFSHGGPTKPTGPSSPGYDTRRLGGSDLRRLSNSYEFEGSMVDEATRMRKELGKEGETRVRGELAARSRAHKRSDSVDKTIAAAERGADRPYIKHKRNESDADRKNREEKQSRTLRGLAAARRGSVRDKPRAGMGGYAAKVEGSDKDLQTARQRAMSAGTLTPKEKKQLGEEYQIYEIVASYLLENNFAETINDANVIIENMSEKWILEILENI